MIYQARFSVPDQSMAWGMREIIVTCGSKTDAITTAISLSRDPDNSGVTAWQIGNWGGDPDKATAQIWHRP
jgi:hypothetical protein